MKLNLKISTLLFAGIILAIPQFANAYCGDGIKQEIEQCDDGNFANRDGCDSYCKLEDLTPPEVTSISIENGATNIDTRTNQINLTFSEEIDKTSVDKITVRFEHKGELLDYDLEVGSDQKTITIKINQLLFSKEVHAIKIRNIKDISGNFLIGEEADSYFVSTFETAVEIDNSPPNVVVRPKGGDFIYTQNVSIKAYVGDYTKSDDFLDEDATIYYTVNDYQIEENKKIYEGEIRLQKNSTLRYFAIDKLGNKTPIFTERYNFKCPVFENASQVVDKYPECKIIECKKSFILKGNSCVTRLGGSDQDINSYKDNSATAPLLPSEKPMYITTKPAIYVTPEHKGIIPRPLIFQDPKRGIRIEFEKDTKIINSKGERFTGYIKTPENLYQKDFPINFGYSFKSIFSFKSAEGEDLQFKPTYKIIIPYSETFNDDEEVKVFTYNENTEKYSEYSRNLYKSDLKNKEVVITSFRTGRFFIAQKGTNFNRSVFTDIQTHWAKNHIESLYRKGIVKGKSKGIFAPNDHLTRAEFIKIALKSIGEKIETLDEEAESPFNDVPLFSWYAPYIKKAKEIGLVKGYEDGTFKPDQKINRAEAIKILFSAFKFNLSHRPETAPESSKKKFIDLKSLEWYYPYAQFAIHNEIMKGAPSISNDRISYFYPALPVTRAEMAKIAIKTMELKDNMK